MEYIHCIHVQLLIIFVTSGVKIYRDDRYHCAVSHQADAQSVHFFPTFFYLACIFFSKRFSHRKQVEAEDQHLLKGITASTSEVRKEDCYEFYLWH